MTAVGKILVFMNLVFSLAVMGFATVDYIARTNWKDRFDKEARRYNSVKASEEAYRAEANRLTTTFNAYNQKLFAEGNKDLQLQPQDAGKAAEKAIAVIQARNKEIEDLRDRLDKTNTKLADANKEITKYEAATTTIGADNKRRQADVEKSREILKSEIQRNSQLVLEKNALRDQRPQPRFRSSRCGTSMIGWRTSCRIWRGRWRDRSLEVAQGRFKEARRIRRTTMSRG
jgi:hypothetical protein